jgi:5-methylcytosine-specific restriction endonuclease McrA
MSRSKGQNPIRRGGEPSGDGRIGGRFDRLHGAGGGHAHAVARQQVAMPNSASANGETGDDGVSRRHGGPRPTRVNAALTGPVGGIASALDCKVLVLNKLYMAVRVTSARRAFGMLFRDLAEVIHVENGVWTNYDFATWAELSELRREMEREKHDWVRTVRFDLAVPRVIRLLGYDRLPKQHVKLNRRNLFARDGNRCQYCGRTFPTQELSIDHVVPRTQGGGESWENLVCSCVKCNAKKGGRTPAQARMDLIKKPTQPRRNPLISVKLGQQRYESWKAFLDEAYWSVELR